MGVLVATLSIPGFAARWGAPSRGDVDVAGGNGGRSEVTTSQAVVATTLAEGTAKGTGATAPRDATRTAQPTPDPGAPGSIFKSVRTDRRVVALTFDDGPSSGLDEVLDALSRSHSRATFFVVGKRCEGNEAKLMDVVAAGHELGNHTELHLEVDEECDDAQMRWTITKAQERIRAAGGGEARFFRPPAGRYDDRLPSATQPLGLATALWDVHSWDTNAKTTSGGLISSVAARVRPGSIVLLHETSAVARRALPELIRRLRADGYELVTLSELVAAGEAL